MRRWRQARGRSSGSRAGLGELGRRGPGTRAGGRRARSRRGRRAARPELPRRLRRGGRARPRLERAPAGLDRARLAERQPRARARAPGRGLRARLLALRLARQPGRPRRSRARGRARRPRADPRDRPLLRGLPRRARVRPRGREAVAGGKPVVLLAVGRQRGERPGGPLAHGRARQRPRGGRRRLPCRRHRPRGDAEGARRRSPRRCLARPCRAGGESPSSATAAATASSRPTSPSAARPRAAPPLGRRSQAGSPRRSGPTASTRNPVDFAGGGEQDSRDASSASAADRARVRRGATPRSLTGYFGGYSEISERVPQRARARRRPAAWPAPLATRHARSSSSRCTRPHRRRRASRGRRARLSRDRGGGGRPRPARRLGLRAGPPACPSFRPRSGDGRGHGRRLLRGPRAARRRPASGSSTARRVESLDEARAAAAEIGYPVVLKALGLLHKSDAGGVVLGIEDRGGARAFVCGYGNTARARKRTPSSGWHRPATGVELIVGCAARPSLRPGRARRARRPLRRAAAAMSPSRWRRSSADVAESLLRSLRGAALLSGARGRGTARRTRRGRGARPPSRWSPPSTRRSPRSRSTRCSSRRRARSGSTPVSCSPQEGDDGAR